VSERALHVVFKLAEAEYALPASDVLQMDSFEGATPVPGAASYVAGLVQVRGHVVPVVDLRARFGLPAITRTIDSRVVVVERDGRAYALLVDAAREVVWLPPADVEATPDGLRDATRGFVRAIARADRRVLMMIDLDTILEEARHGQ
jgi:purine-binding chemotaxis protein CheW